MNTQEKYGRFMKKLNGNTFNNPSTGSFSNRSIGDQELDQRTMQNLKTSQMLKAHHINPEAAPGDIPFTEPSLEDLVQMVKEGKLEKDILGDRADEFLEYGTPNQREKQLEETGSLEIPVVPADDVGKQFLMNKIKK